MNDYGALALGIGNLLGGLGSATESLMGAQKQKRETESLVKTLKDQGYSDEEVAIIKDLPPQYRSKALFDLKQQKELAKRQETSRGAYQNAVASLLGKGSPDQSVDLSALSDKELDKLLNLGLKHQDIESKEVAARQKTAAPIKKEVVAEYKAGRSMKNTLQQIEDLAEHGDLSSPGYIASLRAIGLDNPLLMKKDDVVFEKVRNEFLTKLKTVFGGRITNNEIDLFMKGLPDLMQTKDGMKKVVNIMKTVNKGSKARFQALDEIEEQYGDKLPYNLESLIEKKAKKKLDAISKQLKDIHNPAAATKENTQEEFNSADLPPAASFEGRILRGPQGQQLKSVNGKWIIVG